MNTFNQTITLRWPFVYFWKCEYCEVQHHGLVWYSLVIVTLLKRSVSWVWVFMCKSTVLCNVNYRSGFFYNNWKWRLLMTQAYDTVLWKMVWYHAIVLEILLIVKYQYEQQWWWASFGIWHNWKIFQRSSNTFILIIPGSCGWLSQSCCGSGPSLVIKYDGTGTATLSSSNSCNIKIILYNYSHFWQIDSET